MGQQPLSRFKSERWAVLLAPIRAFRMRYLPLLLIYFAYGASGFANITDSFFIKERLAISAPLLLELGVWLTLPWTIKVVFGQLVDSVTLFGSNRRVYVFIAATLMAAASFILAGLAGRWHFLITLAAPVTLYFSAKLITVIAFVLQDVVADAMSVEVVSRTGRSEDAITHDLAMVQLLGRMFLMTGIFLVAGLGGWLAHHFSYETMYLFTLFIPLISVLGCCLVRLDATAKAPLNKKIFYGGCLFGAFVVVVGLLAVPFCQEIVFVVSMIVIIYFLHQVTKDSQASARKKIYVAAIVIFVFRAMPAVGPGLHWWQIDVLGFSKSFFGTLGQIGAGLSIVGLWLMAKYITSKPIAWILILLSIVYAVLSLPVLGMYYGLHHWTAQHFGFGAHTIALVDTALESPFAQLSMVPMLTLIASNAPRGNAATWFALMASFMNLALTGGAIMTKLLNQVWHVTREIKTAAGGIITHADYSQLGVLLWISILASLLIPILFVVIFMHKDLRRRP